MKERKFLRALTISALVTSTDTKDIEHGPRHPYLNGISNMVNKNKREKGSVKMANLPLFLITLHR